MKAIIIDYFITILCFICIVLFTSWMIFHDPYTNLLLNGCLIFWSCYEIINEPMTKFKIGVNVFYILLFSYFFSETLYNLL